MHNTATYLMHVSILYMGFEETLIQSDAAFVFVVKEKFLIKVHNSYIILWYLRNKETTRRRRKKKVKQQQQMLTI